MNNLAPGTRLRILPSSVLKERIHGAECTLVEERKGIYEVVLDKSDKHDVNGPLVLPKELFEMVVND